MISVIVPVHNAEKTLERAVASVFAQTIRKERELELVLVDDGSGDTSSALCDACRKREERRTRRADEEGGHGENGGSDENGSAENAELKAVSVQVIHMQDEGVSEARNRGLLAAHGDLVTFLDADDAMDPRMLEFLYHLHETTGADICGCGFCRVTPEEEGGNGGALSKPDEGSLPKENAEKADGCRVNEPAEDTSGKEDGVSLLQGEKIITDAVLCRDTRVWSKLFTRSVIGEHRFQKGLTIGEDMLFVVSLIGQNTLYAKADERELYLYTINPKGAMERPFTPSYMDQIRCWEEAEDVLNGNFPELLKQPDVRAQLASLQIVSDVLTASKIAKLPKEERKACEAEFALCRKKLSVHLRIPGSRAGIPADYRIKSFLLEKLPGIYRRLYE